MENLEYGVSIKAGNCLLFGVKSFQQENENNPVTRPQQMRKRLDALSVRLASSAQTVLVFRSANETEEDVDRKIELWKSGEQHDDMHMTGDYEGGQLEIKVIHFVASKMKTA